jgi:hypothetical protein
MSQVNFDNTFFNSVINDDSLQVNDYRLPNKCPSPACINCSVWKNPNWNGICHCIVGSMEVRC